jgi:hypothetical protein
MLALVAGIHDLAVTRQNEFCPCRCRETGFCFPGHARRASSRPVDFTPIRFDFAPTGAEHCSMERLDHTRTVAAALVQISDAGADHSGADHTINDHAILARKVDTLVDGYLVSFASSARQTTAMRKILADEFLSLAPFTELSYRIWRRIMREDTDLPEPPLRVASDLLLPDLDFSPRAAFVPPRAPAQKPSDLAVKKAPRPFFGLRRS